MTQMESKHFLPHHIIETRFPCFPIQKLTPCTTYSLRIPASNEPIDLSETSKEERTWWQKDRKYSESSISETGRTKGTNWARYRNVSSHQKSKLVYMSEAGLLEHSFQPVTFDSKRMHEGLTPTRCELGNDIGSLIKLAFNDTRWHSLSGVRTVEEPEP